MKSIGPDEIKAASVEASFVDSKEGRSKNIMQWGEFALSHIVGRNAPMSRRINAVAVLPAIGMLYAMAGQIADKVERATLMDELNRQVGVVEAASNMGNDIQIERGLSSLFITASGDIKNQYKGNLDQHRLSADGKIGVFSSMSTSYKLDTHPSSWVVQFGSILNNTRVATSRLRFGNALEGAEKNAVLLAELRKNVDGEQVDLQEAIKSYSNIIQELISLSSVSFAGIEEIDRRLLVISFLEKWKEKMGQLRAKTTAAFAKDTFSDADIRDILRIQGEAAAYLNNAKERALPEHKGAISWILNTPAFQQIREVEAALERKEELSPKFVFDTYSAGIEEIFKVSAEIVKEVPIVSNAFLHQAEKEVRNSLLEVSGLLTALILLVGSIVRGLRKDFKNIGDNIHFLAQGQLDEGVKGDIERKDEIGEMLRELVKMREELLRVRELENQNQQQKRINERQLGENQLKMADGLEKMIEIVLDNLEKTAAFIEESAQAVMKRAEETRNNATGVAASTEEVQRSMQGVAGAIEEMRATAEEIAGQMKQVSDLVGRSSESVDSMGRVISSLKDQSDAIGGAAKLITAIAHQTRLLALNATIEAARAGETGRGFVVVADEVKRLAGQTAAAAEDIGPSALAIGNTSISAADQSSAVIAHMKLVEESVSSTAASTEQQQGAAAEISANAHQVSSAANEIAANTNSMSQQASETEAAAEQMLRASHNLREVLHNLKVEVHSYIAEIRKQGNDMIQNSEK